MPKLPDRIINSGFSIQQFCAYAALSCVNPFVTLILTDRGMDYTSIGLVLTANSLIAILAQPFWGMVSDRIHSIQKVYMICLISASLIYLLVPWARTLSILILLLPAVNFFVSPIAPLMDTWIFQAMKNQPGKSFGMIRFWGSIGFAAVMIFVGRMVSLTSIHVTSYAFALISLISITISFNLPKTPSEGRLNILAHKEAKPGIGKLLHSYRYLTFILCVGILFLAVQPMFGFLPRLLLAVGGTSEMYSWLMAICAFMEIPIFIGSKYLLSRFRPIQLVIAAMGFFVLRIFLYSIAPTPTMLILISLLHGLTYALFVTGTVSYLDEITPEGLKSTALTLGSAIYAGVSGIIGNTVAGRLMDVMTIQPVYKIGAWLALGAMSLFIILLLIGRRLPDPAK